MTYIIFSRFVAADDSNEDSDVASSSVAAAGSVTRSGRQTKPVPAFTILETEPRPARSNSTPVTKARKRTLRSDSVSILSGAHIDPHLAPLVTTPPSGTSHNILEDTETGQRLLLVKSPPPVGEARHRDGDFVHVYLMSPTNPRRRPSECRQASSPEVLPPAEVFIPPSVASPSPHVLREEVITDVEIIDLDADDPQQTYNTHSTVQDDPQQTYNTHSTVQDIFTVQNMPNQTTQNSQSSLPSFVDLLEEASAEGFRPIEKASSVTCSPTRRYLDISTPIHKLVDAKSPTRTSVDIAASSEQASIYECEASPGTQAWKSTDACTLTEKRLQRPSQANTSGVTSTNSSVPTHISPAVHDHTPSNSNTPTHVPPVIIDTASRSSTPAPIGPPAHIGPPQHDHPPSHGNQSPSNTPAHIGPPLQGHTLSHRDQIPSEENRSTDTKPEHQTVDLTDNEASTSTDASPLYTSSTIDLTQSPPGGVKKEGAVKKEQPVLQLTQQEVSHLYDNAEILTITNDDGQVIEILIDPGMVADDDGGQVFDIEVTHPDRDTSSVAQS